MPACCHSANGRRRDGGVGASAATNSLEDLDRAKLITVVVAPIRTESHPVIGAKVPTRASRRAAHRHRPSAHRGGRAAAIHLQLRPGTNVALFDGLGDVIAAEV